MVSERTRLISNNIKERLDEAYADGNLIINNTEGKIYLDKNIKDIYLFSSIGPAELNCIQGARIETDETTQSKKNASIGGAMLGGLVGGSFGATIGGSSLGKSNTKTSSITNQIATCQHLGVMVQLDDQVKEIVLIDNEVDQASNRFIEKYKEAQTIIVKLDKLSKTPVPTNYVQVDKMENVLECDKQIDDKQMEYDVLKNNKPAFAIPSVYRQKENLDLSDEEYLKFLKDNDEIRQKNEQENAGDNSNTVLELLKKILGGVDHCQMVPRTVIYCCGHKSFI